MSLRDAPNVLDIRTCGLAAGIDLAPHPDGPGARGFAVMERAFHDHDLVVRISGDTLALSPPLIVGADDIAGLVERLGKAIRAAT